ncbi:anti-sigma factor domain-containing protein [Conexibacter sp. CPCC 206217]|uniref:anti-sigma factor n=1 Tax=Conexibacter sp. CPCC 206217 TaxID=3064574 RepID=UPI002717FDDC|nr:anti-sigma factor [Conexibacter sp. CPCC 206217]MDO8209502.1 anti-sigma factor [Conexibacter sp. CPCC 206217]
MNVADDHSRWDEDLAAYAIGALDSDDTVAFARHLAGCDRCRGELHRLAPVVELLPASVEQLEPPPALRGRIMAAIAQEPAGAAAGVASTHAPEPAPAPAPHRRRSTLRERIRGWHVPALPAVLTGAAVAAAFAVGFLVRGGDSTTSPQRTTVPVVAAVGGGDVRGQLISEGGAWHLDVSRLPQPRAGNVYQAWVMRRGRDVEPSTVFVLARDGSSTVAIPQSLSNGDQVLVTQEPSGGSAAPTSRPLLSASV